MNAHLLAKHQPNWYEGITSKSVAKSHELLFSVWTSYRGDVHYSVQQSFRTYFVKTSFQHRAFQYAPPTALCDFMVRNYVDIRTFFIACKRFNLHLSMLSHDSKQCKCPKHSEELQTHFALTLTATGMAYYTGRSLRVSQECLDKQRRRWLTDRHPCPHLRFMYCDNCVLRKIYHALCISGGRHRHRRGWLNPEHQSLYVVDIIF